MVQASLKYGTPPPFIPFAEEVVTKPFEYIREIPIREEKYQEGEVFRFTPTVSKTYRRETVSYGQPKLTPTGEYEKEKILIQL